jgi:hypothetical protein
MWPIPAEAGRRRALYLHLIKPALLLAAGCFPMVPQESNVSFADDAKKAQDLRNKAQQLAVDELSIMNQAVALNLMAKQVRVNNTFVMSELVAAR